MPVSSFETFILLYYTALIVNRESCTISFIVTIANYVYLYDICDSENKITYLPTGTFKCHYYNACG